MLEMLSTHNIIWHPIYQHSVFPERLLPKWVEPCYCTPTPNGWHPANWKANYFLDHWNIEENDRYANLSDDDFYEPGFYRKISKHKGDVVVVSMRRGDVAIGGYPKHTLVAKAENLKGAGIGGQQLIVSGRVIRGFRYGREYAGDWEFISKIISKHRVEFAPEAFVYFNYLQPGRWRI